MALTPVEEPVNSLKEDIAKVFETHHALVLRTAWRVTGNVVDAEDVLQTVFLRLLRRNESRPAPENIEAYLHRAAVNASLDIVRARREHLPVEAVDTDEQPASPPDATSRDLHEILCRTFAALAPRAAEILVLRFLEGYSNREIADRLGISPVRVAVVVHRGRGRLQKEFKRYQEVKS